MVNCQLKIKNYILFSLLFSIIYYLFNSLDTKITTTLWINQSSLINFVLHIFFYPVLIFFTIIILLKVSNFAQNISEMSFKKLVLIIIIYFLLSVIYKNNQILNFYFLFLPSYLIFIILMFFIYKIKELKTKSSKFIFYSLSYLMSNLILLYYIHNSIFILEKYNINLIIFLAVLIKNIGIYYLVKFIEICDSINLKEKIIFIINTIIDFILMISFINNGIKTTFLIMTMGYIIIWGLYKLILFKKGN